MTSRSMIRKRKENANPIYEKYRIKTPSEGVDNIDLMTQDASIAKAY